LAFSDCLSLATICIPSSVERICDYSFNRCQSLSRITFERRSKISFIGRFAFSDCSSLSSICVPSAIEWYCHPTFRFPSFDGGDNKNCLKKNGSFCSAGEEYDERYVGDEFEVGYQPALNNFLF
jgi:hypothetical protein